MEKTTKKSYTYLDWVGDVLRLIEAVNHEELEGFDFDLMFEKTLSFRASQERRAEAAKNNKKEPKGPSDTTLEVGNAILDVLAKGEDKALTSSEIADKVTIVELNPLRIANALKYQEGWEKTKVIRTVVDSKGLKAEREYTAYFLN